MVSGQVVKAIDILADIPDHLTLTTSRLTTSPADYLSFPDYLPSRVGLTQTLPRSVCIFPQPAPRMMAATRIWDARFC